MDEVDHSTFTQQEKQKVTLDYLVVLAFPAGARQHRRTHTAR
jgi:hypothetical protein